MQMKTALAVLALGCSWMAPSHAGDFLLTSPDIPGDGFIPSQFEFNGFGCKGSNRSPMLRWSGAPKTVRSFAITVHDPDAPTGSGWWHWVVVNIPANVAALAQDAGNSSGASLPAGARQVRNDFGAAAWGGVCPPAGSRPHRYVFTVHALKSERIELPAEATAAHAAFMINADSLGKAVFVARYAR